MAYWMIQGRDYPMVAPNIQAPFALLVDQLEQWWITASNCDTYPRRNKQDFFCMPIYLHDFHDFGKNSSVLVLLTLSRLVRYVWTSHQHWRPQEATEMKEQYVQITVANSNVQRPKTRLLDLGDDMAWVFNKIAKILENPKVYALDDNSDFEL